MDSGAVRSVYPALKSRGLKPANIGRNMRGAEAPLFHGGADISCVLAPAAGGVIAWGRQRRRRQKSRSLRQAQGRLFAPRGSLRSPRSVQDDEVLVSTIHETFGNLGFLRDSLAVSRHA